MRRDPRLRKEPASLPDLIQNQLSVLGCQFSDRFLNRAGYFPSLILI